MKLLKLSNVKCKIGMSLLVMSLIISSLILVFIASLTDKTTTTDSLFNLTLFIIALISSFFLMRFSSSGKMTRIYMFISLIFALFCLRLLMSITTSPDVLWGPDLKYELQIINNIESSRHLMTGTFTGEATSYRHFPGLELNILSLSLVAGYSKVTLLKYLGAFLGVFFVILSERFFFGIFRDRAISFPSSVIVGFCPFLVGINSFTIHQSLGIIFLCLFMWGLVRAGWRWKIVSGISIIGIFVTHSLTTYMIILVIVLTFFYYIISVKVLAPSEKMSISKKNLHISAGIIICLILVVMYLTPPEVLRGIDRIWSTVFSSLFTSGNLSLYSLMPVGLKPIWMVVMQFIGFFIFGISILYFLLKTFRSKNKAQAIPYVFGMVGITIFVGFLFIWVSGVTFAGELRWRSFIYLYLFASPLFFITIHRISNSISNHQRYSFIKNHHAVLSLFIPIMLLTPVFVAGVYHGTSPDVYLHDYPISYSDARLPHHQWVTASDYSRPIPSINFSYGVRLAWEYMGAYGYKYVNPLVYEVSLYEWTQEHNGTILIIRESMKEVPDYIGIVPPDEFQLVVYENNLLYSNGEVLIIRTND